MNFKSIKRKLKTFAGFATAVAVVFATNFFLQIEFNSPMMAFLFLAVLFTIEYAMVNSIGYVHITVIFFWVFQIMWVEKSNILFSFILGSITAFIPLAMHLKIKEKNKKPR